jgi:hypothetical protein
MSNTQSPQKRKMHGAAPQKVTANLGASAMSTDDSTVQNIRARPVSAGRACLWGGRLLQISASPSARTHTPMKCQSVVGDPAGPPPIMLTLL